MSQLRIDLDDLDVDSLIEPRDAIQFLALHFAVIAGALWLAGVFP